MTSINTNVSPYYDDFNEDKNFHRLLFQPTRAIQARELTQLQTVLQNQISRFGENIFKDGSIIIPGGVSVDTNYDYVKLQETDISTALVGNTLTGQTSGNIGKLLQKVEVAGADPATFYVEYTSGGRFSDGESIVVSGTGSGTFTAAASSATGQGTKVNLDKGIFFIKGFFVAAVTQSLIIEKYGIPTGKTEVGITTTESIVTSNDDTSLLSNAAGTNNVNAPGADRLKITSTLVEKSSIEDSNGETSVDYISLAIVQDGVIVEKFLRTQYNILGDQIAERTFEESGNYTIDPFILDIENHSTNTAKLTLNIDEGIAFVRGRRIEKNLTTSIDINKATSTEIVNNSKTSTSFGNYVRTQTPTDLPDISTFQSVNLTDSGSSTIGTARVRAVSKESSTIYRFYLFEVSLNATKKFNQVRTLDSSPFTTTLINDADAALSTDTAELKDTSNSDLLFKIPQERIKDITDITVRVQKYTTGTTNGSGDVTLNTGSSSVTWETTSDWIVTRDDTGAVVTPTFGSTGAQTILLSGLTATQAHTIIAYVDKTTATTNARTKTLTTKTDQALSALTTSTTEILLGETDIYQVTAIKDAADNSDITDRYLIDNGQRDNFYEEGKIILKTGETAPTGDSLSDVLVTFTYFEHGASGDYFNVDSYDGFVGSNSYADIPSHTLSDGTSVRLSDVFDFRPRKDDNFVNFSSAGAVINELPKNNETIQGDVEYFLPRIDTLYLDYNGNFGITTGNSSLTPKVNPAPNTAMPIYNILLNAGTFDLDDVTLSFIDNRRYTMRDIGQIESRINRLEEWATLSLLETDTSSLEVLDNAGNNRFKSGFFVDDFKSHNFADTLSNEYKASVDIQKGLLGPEYIENNARLVYKATASDSSASSNVVKIGDSLMLSYSQVTEFTQPYATESVNVNPYLIKVYIGAIDISPKTDEWRDVETKTRSVVRTQNAATQSSRVSRFQRFNRAFFRWDWFGAARINTNNGSFVDNLRIDQERGPLLFNRGEAFQFAPSNNVINSIQTTSDTRVLNVTLIPFIRSRKVYFYAKGLLPNTTHTPYFDGVDVTTWCKEETFTRIADSTTQDSTSANNSATTHPDGTTALISDANGEIQGSFFIPNTSALRFRTGAREFKLWDTTATTDDNALSKAYATYTAKGTLETSLTTVTTIRLRPPPPRPRPSRRRDPVAQSFVLPNKEGGFITSFDIPFRTASTTAPISCQLRRMDLGLPTEEVIAETWLNASSFAGKTSASPSLSNSSTYVTFTFDEPVYLQGNTEYCVVLISDSLDYEVWTGLAGDFLVGSTTRRLMKQPTLGSFFKSQNSSTWTPDQKRDMMFRMKRASFTTSAAKAYFENVNLPVKKLVSNPIETTNASGTIRVYHKNHGLVIGDKVTLAGAATTNGITAAQINIQQTVVDADDFDSYTVTTAGTATSSGKGGGSSVTAQENYVYSISHTTVNMLNLPSTTSTFAHKTVSGQSIAGAETAYQKDSSYGAMVPNTEIEHNTIRLVASSENETASLSGDQSYALEASLQTTSNYVSPVIDLQRLSVTLISDRIDRQASSTATGFNVPASFVAETDALNGSSIAKHIIKPVTLTEEAIGLKVIFAANRPSSTYIDLYYKVAPSGSDVTLNDTAWTLATIDEAIQTDDQTNIFRDYIYTIEESPFTKFVFKFVFSSSDQAKSPIVKDLRVIALAT